MDDNATPNPNAAAAAAAAQQHQQHQQLLQRQLYLMQQQQQQQQQQQTQQLSQTHFSQQQAAAISRFPSNIDAHLRSPGLRFQTQAQAQAQAQSQSQPQPQPQPLSQPQSQTQTRGAAAGVGGGRGPEVEMALQDAVRVCNPDVNRPFESIEDAVNRLLPYHVVADYEAEEDDRILDNDTTGQIPSRLQQWDHNILVKIAEFTTTFDKQVLAFNIMTRKRALGEFRSEERLMLEQGLLQEEKQAMMELRAEIESREKAGREAAEAKMRMAMAEHARVESQAHSEVIGRGPMRANVAASQGEDGPSHDMAQDQGANMDEWGNAQRDDEEPSEDFLNDENEPENGDSGMQDDWRGSGELDLNTR